MLPPDGAKVRKKIKCNTYNSNYYSFICCEILTLAIRFNVLLINVEMLSPIKKIKSLT